MSTTEELLLKIGGDSTEGQAAAQRLADVLSNSLTKALKDMGDTSEKSGSQVSGLTKYLDDLKPSTDHAHAAFTDLRGTLNEMWENPTKAVGNLSNALSQELTTSLAGTEGASSGLVVGLGLFAGAAAAAGAVAFELAQRAIETGEAFQDFSYKTSISVEAASQLDYVAKAAGSSLDQMGNAIFMMQRRMADDDSGAFDSALEKIHLTLEQIKDLSPDEQFLKIAEAFRENTDQTNRASVAMALFGRSGRDIVPLMMKDLDDLNEKAKAIGHTMSGEDAKSLEDYGISWHGFEAAISWTADQTGLGVIHFFETLGTRINQAGYLLASFIGDVDTARIVAARLEGALPKAPGAPTLFQGDSGVALSRLAEKGAEADLAEQLKVTNQARKEAEAETAKYEQAVQNLVDTLEGHNKKEGETVEALQRVAKDGLVLGSDAAERFTASVKDLVAKGVDVPPALLAMAKAESDHTDAAKLDVAVTALQTHAYEDLMIHLTSLIPVYQDWAAMLPQGGGEIEVLGSRSLPLATSALTDFTAENKKADEALKAGLASFRNSPDDIGMFESAIAGLPDVLERTFAHGGNPLKAAGSLIGKNLGTSISDGIGESILENTGEEASGFTGALLKSIPVIGSLLGPLLSKLFSNLGGPSQQELAGRSTEASFESSFGGVTQMIDSVGAAYVATGKTVQDAQADVNALFAAEKQGGPAVQAAIDKINLSFTAQTKLTADVKTGVDNIVTAAGILGGKAPAALQPMIDKLLTMNGLTDDEKKSLSDLSGAGTPSINDLTAAAGRYGLSLDSVGGKAAQLSISTEADQIESDYKTLVTDSGADSDKVLAGMKDSLNTLVDHAMDAGAVLPTALEPLVKQLFDTGQLTDAAGNKITDFSKLKFDDTGDPLATGIETLTDDLDTLVKILTNDLPGAAKTAADGIASNLGKGITVPIHVVSDGGDNPDVPRAAGGIYATGKAGVATWFGEGGQPELGGPVDFMSAAIRGAMENGAGLGGSGTGITINVAGSVWSANDLADVIHQKLGQLVTDRRLVRVGS